MKNMVLACVLASLAFPAFAEDDAAAAVKKPLVPLEEDEEFRKYNKNFEQMFRDTATVLEMTPSEKLAVDKYQEWSTSGARSLQSSYVTSDGSIVFTYGAQMPTLICSLLQISDIELERGEVINSVNLGDTARWSVEPAVEGSDDNTIQHVLVKPLDIGLETSMLITTDRRAYRLKLKSVDGDGFLPHVSFVYPDQALAKFAAMRRMEAAEKEKQSISVYGKGRTYLGNLNFNYEIEGDVSWKPVRVYDDGEKTLIEMPESMLADAAPTLMVLDREGGIFTSEQVSIINYRLQDARYVVDGLFEQAILTKGVGSDQQRVVIKRKAGGK